MSQFLDEMLKTCRSRVAAMGSVPTDRVCERASLIEAVRGKDRLSVIAEFKRRSPSRGVISESLGVEEQVSRYFEGGAAAISVLTEPSQFGGSYQDLERAAHAVSLPLLMKDFVVDAKQLHAGVMAGASAALLIVRCLPVALLEELAAVCRELGLTPLIECSTEAELELALAVDDAVIGINNRDLSCLKVDRARALRLLPLVPEDRVVVAESGYSVPEELRELEGRADAVLIGTAFMTGTGVDSLLGEVNR